MFGTAIVLLVYLAIVICIPALIGVYVYQDAKERGMNAALWTLIAVLSPALIGFIIYLLVRSSYSNLKCPQCQKTVSEQYVSCPNCGVKLKAACPGCLTPVEEGWKVCPKCAAPLPEFYDDVFAPVKKKDKMLGRILAAVILIPVLLIVVTVGSFFAFSGSSGTTGVTSMPVDEYLHEVNNPQIEEWLNSCGEDYDKAYVLRNEASYGEEGQVKVQYLVYMPRVAEDSQMSMGTSAGMFGDTFELKIGDSRGNRGNTVILVTWTGDAAPKLKLYYGGDRVKCEITDVDYPVGLSGRPDIEGTDIHERRIG